jgi:small subunit ribosomal protein S2
MKLPTKEGSMPTKKTATTVAKSDKTIAVKELLQAGAHFGHRTERWHPKMAPYIHGARGGVHIIDLVQTEDLLEKAEKFVRQITAQGKEVLFVATKRQAKVIVTEAAKSAGMPYVTHRWLGGMMTNWETISKRIRHLKKLEVARADGSLDRMTKKERLLIDNEIEKLTKVFLGVKELESAPGAIFVVDVMREVTAIKEAKTLKIPVIAMADTNANPELVDYVIPANDDAIRSIQLIAGRIARAASEGKAEYDAKTKQDMEEK